MSQAKTYRFLAVLLSHVKFNTDLTPQPGCTKNELFRTHVRLFRLGVFLAVPRSCRGSDSVRGSARPPRTLVASARRAAAFQYIKMHQILSKSWLSKPEKACLLRIQKLIRLKMEISKQRAKKVHSGMGEGEVSRDFGKMEKWKLGNLS